MRRMYSKPQLLEAVEQEAEINGLKAFENIVDKDGHKRFIDGDIDLYESAPEGFTKVYGKWSLSGSHLLIVFSVKIDNGTSTTAGDWAKFIIPSWVYDKIAIFYGADVVNIIAVIGRDVNGASQTINVNLNKLADNTLRIGTSQNITLSSTKTFRVEFDLLIDNE